MKDGMGLRVSVVGSSGSGKTTFGKAIAARLGLPTWSSTRSSTNRAGPSYPTTSSRPACATPPPGTRWVVDGNYGVVRPIVLERATTVAWLDYSRPRCMQQVIRRSVQSRRPAAGALERKP